MRGEVVANTGIQNILFTNLNIELGKYKIKDINIPVVGLL